MIRRHHVLGIALATLTLAACGGGGRTERLRVSVEGLAFEPRRVAVTVEPAGIEADLVHDAGTDSYSAELSVPPGVQTVEVTAYEDRDGDGVAEAIAVGSVQVLVVVGQTSAVYLDLVEAGPPPVPDHSPMITSLVVTDAAPLSGAEVTLSAAAIDPDGDPLAYLWTQECPATATGAFGSPTEPTTTWLAEGSGQCTLTLTVTAGGRTDALAILVTVSAPPPTTGNLAVAVTLRPAPHVARVLVLEPEGAPVCDVRREPGADATCGEPLAAGTYLVRLWGDAATPASNLVVGDDCGGSIARTETDGAFAEYAWTTPAGPRGCFLTAWAVRDGRVDGLPVFVYVQ